MEAEGEEDIIASDAFIPGIEVALGHGEGVSEVEGAVHVGEGEGLEVFRLRVGLSSKILVSFPDVSGPSLKRNKFVSSGGVLHPYLN